jgi:uncharacterized DUF497 family protein
MRAFPAGNTERAMIFEWDYRKALTNAAKHGLTFNEAKTVFGDPLSLTVLDPDQETDEQRFLIFGRMASGSTIVVSFTERGGNIRLISARYMTPGERKAYEE